MGSRKNLGTFAPAPPSNGNGDAFEPGFGVMQSALAAERQQLVALGEMELVAQARRGSELSFRIIMERNNQRLYRIARTVLKDDAEAEDAVQEAYLRAFAALSTFRGEASLSTWLTRIVL